jgi:ABC-2 type transport system ATP-binding protein
MTGTAEGAARVAVPARSAAPAAVVVAGLRKSYGAVQAVRGVSFTVRHGEIFALLGRRLDLIGRPELLFLDEPTTGFDPNARHEAWDVICGLRGAGVTIMLTTHYMDEAQALADRVAVMAGGQIVAEGTPSDIGGRDTARSRIRFALPDGYTTADLPVDGVLGQGQVSVETAEPTQALHQLTGWALQRGMVLGRLTVDRPSLEDIYLRLTGDDTRIEGSIR